MSKQIRNIAIIAHVDHGKTTMVDQLLRQSGTFAEHEKVVDTVMDNHAIERERGITILAKNCAVSWKDTHINISTPRSRGLRRRSGTRPVHGGRRGAADRRAGRPHAPDALRDQEGAGPGPAPIVVVNKVDKPGANPDKVINAAFDLFDKLGATDEQLDFPWSTPRASTAGLRWKRASPAPVGPDMSALFDTILEHVPSVQGDASAPCSCRSRRWTTPPSWAVSAWAASPRAR
jgi:GTP-binding protein